MKQRVFVTVAIAVCGLAATLMLPSGAHADTPLIGTGGVMVAVRLGPPQNIQVNAGDEQTAEQIANDSTGSVAAALYDGTVHVLTPDMRYDTATLYPVVGNGSLYSGTIHAGPLQGAQVSTEVLGFETEVNPVAAVRVQWNGIDVVWEEVGTTISSNPGYD